MRFTRCLIAALLLAPAIASGNGRPPITDGISFKPGDLHSLYISTTFGLLISHDDGCTFNWVCENNVGYGGVFDPLYRITSDGTIFATTFSGLRISHDDGCSFQTATDNLPPGDPGRLDVWIDALDLGPTGEVWIGTSDATKPNDIYRSVDNGVTFVARGMQSPTISWKSVKVAHSNPQVVYITGYDAAGTASDAGMTQTPHLLHTTDGGTNWTPSALAGVLYGGSPILRVLAIDPRTPDIIYVRSEGANPPMGDRLYRSADGGATLTEVLVTTDPIRGVVVVDETHVLATTQLGGSFQSINNGVAFSAMPAAPQLMCLGQREDGVLVGCGANWDPDFMAVSRSGDGGANWQKVWRFVELAGPVTCPSGTVERDVCDAEQWVNLKAQFGASGPTCGDHVIPPDDPQVQPPPPGGGCCDAGDGAPLAGFATIAMALGLRRRRRV